MLLVYLRLKLKIVKFYFLKKYNEVKIHIYLTIIEPFLF